MKYRRTLFTTLLGIFLLWSPPYASALDVDDPAPDFTAVSTQGDITLSDFKGKRHVVLALYFAVFTSVWRNELIDFQRDLEATQELDAEIIGVSTDSMKTLKKFVDEEGISFPLVSDSSKSIKKQYGGGRITYLIDKNGTIQFVQEGVPDNQEFIRQLQKLQ